MLLFEGKHVLLASQPDELLSNWHGVTTLQRTLPTQLKELVPTGYFILRF